MSEKTTKEERETRNSDPKAFSQGDFEIYAAVIADSVYDQFEAPISRERYIETARTEMQNLLNANADLGTDPVNEANLRFVCIILAFYRCALSWCTEDNLLSRIYEALEKRFMSDLDAYLENRFEIHPDRPQASFQKIDENFIKRGRTGFGAGFTYKQDVQTPEKSFVHITKCFFNDFFRRNNAPEVTQIICKLDMVWVGALEARKHNVRFERPTVLSRGDSHCSFEFSRDDSLLKNSTRKA